MIEITLQLPGGVSHRLQLAAGDNLRDALDTTDYRVRAACGGTGACGACVLRLLEGEANPWTLAEYRKLSETERAAGLRLACQLRPRGACRVALEHPARPSRWKSLPAADLAPPPGALPALSRHIYGVAVDLGTTHIRVSLWDRKRGRRIASRHGPNPQEGFGADVLNRLDAARAGHGPELAKLARAAIVQAIRDMLSRDVGEVKPMLAEIGQLVLVGNTAMLALLTGQGGEALLAPENWQSAIACAPADAETWHAQWFLPNAEILLPPPVAGFIGSDLAADLLATRLAQGPEPALLLDIGTNTEIALWDGRSLRLTSVPGGPAFEGYGIRHGMSAEPGAICRVTEASLDHPAPEAAAPLDVVCATIAGDHPRGYCGSGLLDAIAVLRRQGRLKASGRFALSPGPEGCRLLPDEPRSAITGGDVDAFQRAKAAIAAGMATLLLEAGLAWTDLARLCVCGAFGRHLDVANAQALGLLPLLPAERVELYADASLAGCERLLLCPAESSLEFAHIRQARSINLSMVAGYDDRYIAHLRLLPMPAEA